MGEGITCSRCGRPATMAVVEVSAVTVYVDLCEHHLADLLRGAREVDDRGSVEERSDGTVLP